MSPATIFYVVGSFFFFSAERLFSTNDMLRYPLWLLSGVLVLLAVGWLAMRIGEHRRAVTMGLGFFAISLSSLLPYVLVSFAVFGDDKGGRQLTTAATAAIPLLWTIGALPAMNICRTIYANPKGVHALRLQAAYEGGLALAFGLGMLVPINYLAHQNNQKWDFGFFKTTDAGEATKLVVENVDEPLKVILFFPSANQVLREVQGYFDQLAGPNLSYEVMDKEMEPEAAKQYKVRENGTIVLIRGDRNETVKLGEDFDKASKDLRKLDSKVHTALLKLASSKKTAYFTVGHDEMFWKNAPKDDEKIDLAKKFMESLNFKVKEFGLAEGLGTEIPDDAAIVFVVAPEKPFLPAEIQALKEYRDHGGSLYIMLRPGLEQVDQPLLDLVGVNYTNSTMVTDKERGYAQVTGGVTDRAFVATNKFSSHESVTTLTKRSAELPMIVPNTGAISEQKEHAGKYTAVVKGMPDWFADLNGNYQFDKDTEKRGTVDVAAAVSGPANPDPNKKPEDQRTEWRAMVTADASWLSNVVVMQVAGNQVFFSDTIGWLAQDPSIGGEQESEDDIKIQPTKEGQEYWFWGVIVGVPGLVMLMGTLNVLRRRSRQ